MRIEYDYSREDFINFNMFHMFNHDKAAKKRLAWSKYITALIILATGAVVPNFIGTQNIVYWSLYVIAAIVWVLLYPRYVQGKLEKRIDKVLGDDKSRIGLGRQSLEVSESFMFHTSKKGKTKIRWEEVVDVKESKDYIFIYYGPEDAIVVPKIIFSGRDEEDAFMSEVKTFKASAGKPSSGAEAGNAGIAQA